MVCSIYVLSLWVDDCDLHTPVKFRSYPVLLNYLRCVPELLGIFLNLHQTSHEVMKRNAVLDYSRFLIPKGCLRWSSKRSHVSRIAPYHGTSNTTTNISIEEWHSTTVKCESFYAEQATAAGTRRKCYFYSIDLKGRVYLEGTLPKNMATCLKDKIFLDTFVRNISTINETDYRYLSTHGIEEDYPYVSSCGPWERNFIRPADVPVVFHSLHGQTANCHGTHSDPGMICLCYAGTLTQLFSPSKLFISKRTGKLYHTLDNHKYLSSTAEKSLLEQHRQQHSYGLLSSSVVMALSDYFVDGLYNDNNNKFNNINSNYSGMDFISFYTMDTAANNTTMRETRIPIPWLPHSAEPGPWSFSYYEGLKNSRMR
jgi:hypothetical protein